MRNYDSVQEELISTPKVWLITGVAGFIGSNLLEQLLKLGQTVVGLDNLSTGKIENLLEVQNSVSAGYWDNFTFIEGDICDPKVCEESVSKVDYVLHQAALGSVPRSIANPLNTNESNISGFLNMLEASKNAEVKSFTYAASSSTYGDHPGLPKVEHAIGKPLSPYAVTKLVNEIYADVYSRCFGFHSIGLRYFNVFGRRQDPDGAYAAVIPKWISRLARNEDININGDGQTSRDFTYIDNVVQANILAATNNYLTTSSIYNVAFGERTTLESLHCIIKKSLIGRGIAVSGKVNYNDFRDGDVRHSLASIERAQYELGYKPLFDICSGIELALDWYLKNQSAK